MAVLSAKALHKRIFDKEGDERLIVTPLLDLDTQLSKNGAAIDVRLGTHFLVQRRTNIPAVDPMGKERESEYLNLQSRIIIPYGHHFVLHPNQFALGGTIEYLKLPRDLSGYLIGKSSWGRLGLIVATAVGIHPNFRGIITLELRNMGEVPFYLYPGLRIAQIFFHTVEGELEKLESQSFYAGSTKPESYYRSVDRDRDLINLISGHEDKRDSTLENN